MHGYTKRSFHLLAALLLAVPAVLATATEAEARSADENQEPQVELRHLGTVPLMIFDETSDSATIHNKTEEGYIDYAWRSFIALNQPAQSSAQGLHPKRGSDLSDRPVVWETWPQTGQVFLPSCNWDDYPTWDELQETRPLWPDPTCASPLPQPRPCPQDGSIVLQAINQPGLSIRHGAVGPLADQTGNYVRYQVGLNRTYFEYVRANKYYQADRQLPATFEDLPHDLPGKPGMIEYKSAWKVLDSGEDRSRFYRRKAHFEALPRPRPSEPLDPPDACTGPKPVGLVAFHIHRRTAFGHVAMTFEQVDNVEILEPARLARGAMPSFNPGLFSADPPPYGPRGFQGQKPDLVSYESCPEQGFNCVTNGPTRNVSRATPLPVRVQQANARYQALMHRAGSVLQHYQLIGVQHARSDCSRDWVNGKWSPGCPSPNTDVLINAALESYTQLVNLQGQTQNYSCRGCHQHARPCGVGWDTVEVYEGSLMSYLLSKAKGADTTFDDAARGYNCNQ